MTNLEFLILRGLSRTFDLLSTVFTKNWISKNWISKNWISKNWKSIDIHCWTSRYSLLDIPIFIVGHLDIHCWTSRYSLLDIPIFIVGHPSMNSLRVHQWIWSINEYIGPLSLGLSLGPSWPTWTYELNELIFRKMTVFFCWFSRNLDNFPKSSFGTWTMVPELRYLN